MNLTITAGSVPSGTEFPGTVQDLLNMLAEYLGVGGQDTFDGVIVGASTPGPESRGMAWFKVSSSGQPVGWFWWDGAAWSTFPTILPSGPTSGRPFANLTDGQKYFDTDIHRELVYERDSWRTSDGSPGEVRMIDKQSSGYADITAVLTANPGWVEFTAGAGRVLGCAGDGSSSGLSDRNAGDAVGEEAHALTTDELPSHSHGIPAGNGTAHADGNAASGILSDHTATTTDNTGGGQGHNNMQPTLFCWAIVKQ